MTQYIESVLAEYQSKPLLDLVRPFFSLSYKTDKPAAPDAFPNWNFYDIGPLDACFVIGTIATFAVLREIVRLRIMTPFANKWLFGDTRGYIGGSYKLNSTPSNSSNGKPNGRYTVRKISAKNRVRERNVIRFAEQGWAITYCTIWWCFGVVSFLLSTNKRLIDTIFPSGFISHFQQLPGIWIIYG